MGLMMNVHDPKVKSTPPENQDQRDRLPAQSKAGSDDVYSKREDERKGPSGKEGAVSLPAPDMRSENISPDDTRFITKLTRALRAFVRLLMMTVLPLIVIAAGYSAYFHLKALKPEAPKKPKVERAFAVVSTVVQPGTYQPHLKLFGTAVTGRQVDIRSLVSGRVIETSKQLREGGEVSTGDVLLTIDPFDYENALTVAKAQLREAKARKEELKSSLATDAASLRYAKEQAQLSQKDLDRAKPLANRGAVTYRTVDDRQQVLLQREQAADQLKNNIKVWNARIAQQEATIARLKASIDFTTLRLRETKLIAHFNAYVTGVDSQVGRMVSANDKVATLIDRDWIEARFTMTDEQFGRIVSREGSLLGRPVSVDWVLGNTKFTYKATVERLGARVSSASGGIQVFARLEDPSKPVPLHPGAFVEINIPDSKYEDVFRLSGTSLYFTDTVFVIENKRLSTRKVQVVGSDGENLLVRGDLKAGDRVLKTRISTPGDGVLVQEIKKQ